MWRLRTSFHSILPRMLYRSNKQTCDHDAACISPLMLTIDPSAIDQYIGDFAKDGDRDLSVVWRPVTPGATACTVAEGRAPIPSHHA